MLVTSKQNLRLQTCEANGEWKTAGNHLRIIWKIVEFIHHHIPIKEISGFERGFLVETCYVSRRSRGDETELFIQHSSQRQHVSH